MTKVAIVVLFASSACAFQGRSLVNNPLLRAYDARWRSIAPKATALASSELDDVLRCAEKAARAAGALMISGRGAEVRKTKANPRDLLTEVDGAAQKAIEACVASDFPSHKFLGEESVEAGQAASKIALNSALRGGSDGWLWVVDPIDGTTNFASGLTLSAVSIGVAFKGELQVGVVYDPFMDEMFACRKGLGATVNGWPIAVAQSPGHLEAEEVLSEAVVFAGSPPAVNSMMPSLRGVEALMPRVRTIRMVGSAALMFAWVAAGRASAYFEADLNAWDSAAGALLIHEAGGRVVDLSTLEHYSLSTRRILATNGDGRLINILHRVLGDADALELDGAIAEEESPSASSAEVCALNAQELEALEEQGRVLDRQSAWAEKPKDEEVEAQRIRMLAELDELLALGRDGVVKKLENDE